MRNIETGWLGQPITDNICPEVMQRSFCSRFYGNTNCFPKRFAMLIKQKDDLEPTVTALTALLDLKTLTERQRNDLQDELSNVRAGAKGEREAAYHIDFRLKDTDNWAVIHDLRLEINGRVAQIDHLLINRMLQIFVIESKNVKTAVRFNGVGEFEVKTRYGWKGMASPVEQNNRHIRVLKDLVDYHEMAPVRLGIRLAPTYHNWVLIAPECNLSRKGPEEATILKMDMFGRALDEHVENKMFKSVFSVAKLCSADTVQEFAQKLVRFHKPITFDYAAKFGITDPQKYSEPAPAQIKSVKIPVAVVKSLCEMCEVPIEEKVANYCRSNEKRFAGKILCRTCQTTTTDKIVAPAPFVSISGPSCNQCETPVDAKVVAFCRFNRRRFGGRVFCRECQVVAVGV